jgi:L-arabinokinase
MSASFTASSPGRLDVMGGIADYSGSLVLQMPIRYSTTVTITLRSDFQCQLKSQLPEDFQQADFDYQEIKGKDYSQSHKILVQKKEARWIAYILGCALVLEKEKGINFKGADFLIESEVPLGKGVSSSAALEVATMKALAKAFNINFDGTELPTLAQRVENIIVGAPCGLMDQLASYFGLASEFLPIICQPDKLQKPIQIPEQLHFIGVDSGVRHAVSGSSYGEVRCAAFMGYSIIAQHLGVSISEIQQAKATKDWSGLPFGGYLCNVSVDEFNSDIKKLLPERISGKGFLEKYKHTTDSVTVINPTSEYHVLNCTAHPVYENERVKKFQSILTGWKNEPKQAIELGKLMYMAHEGYTICRLGSNRTDEIVALGRAHENAGIYGAKITGGGSGGTVCLLAVGDEGLQSAKKIHRIMEEKYQTKLAYFD